MQKYKTTKRSVCQFLNEAPLPALVLAFAVSQSRLGAGLKCGTLVPGRPPVAVQIDEGVQRSLDSSVLVRELRRSDDTPRAYIWIFSPKRNQLFTINKTDHSSNTD